MPTYLDLGVIVIVLISAFLAMLRGFTREFLAVASWIAAAAAGYYFYPYVLPYVKPYISKYPYDMGVSVAAVFFVALIVVSIITINLSDAILDSKVGALDRSLGFLFGVARGFLLCVIAFVFYSMFDPSEKKEWVRDARTRPLLQSVGNDIQAMLPHDLLNNLIKTKTATPAEEPPPEPDTPADKAAPDADSPAPLPPPRNNGGKEPR